VEEDGEEEGDGEEVVEVDGEEERNATAVATAGHAVTMHLREDLSVSLLGADGVKTLLTLPALETRAKLQTLLYLNNTTPALTFRCELPARLVGRQSELLQSR
jgi:hypothetical protein